MQKNQFYVSTSLQVLNAIEYIYRFNKENDINEVIVLNKTQHTLEEIKGALSLFSNWSNISILYPKWYFNLKLKKLQPIVDALWSRYRLSRLLDKSAYTVLGHDRTLYCRYVSKNGNPAGQVLLDDGTCSINYYFRETFKSLSRKGKLISLIYGLKEYRVQPQYFFTAYKDVLEGREANSITFVENDYSFLNSFSKSKRQGKKVYFVGDLLVERNRTTEAEYMQNLNELKSMFGEELYYVRRQGEDLDKLNRISDLMRVVSPTVPFELYLLTSEELPSKLVGYHSTVLFNVHKILGNSIPLYFIRLRKFNSSVYQAEIQAVHKELEKIATELNYRESDCK